MVVLLVITNGLDGSAYYQRDDRKPLACFIRDYRLAKRMSIEYILLYPAIIDT